MLNVKLPLLGEQKKLEEKRKEVQAATAEAADRLIHCLKSDSFREYKEQLEKAERDLIGVGIGIMRDMKTPDNRVKAYDALFVRAEILGLLLKGVEKDESRLESK